MAGKMAAAELKHDIVSCYETVKRNVSTAISHREIECYRFRLLDLIYYMTSVSFFFVDIATGDQRMKIYYVFSLLHLEILFHLIRRKSNLREINPN